MIFGHITFQFHPSHDCPNFWYKFLIPQLSLCHYFLFKYYCQRALQRVWLYDVEFLEFVKIRKDWRLEEKGMTEDEMVGWHHWLNGHEFEQAPGVGDGQGGLVCCSPWGHKELDTTERLNWTELLWTCTQWFLKIIRSMYSLKESFSLIVFICED